MDISGQRPLRPKALPSNIWPDTGQPTDLRHRPARGSRPPQRGAAALERMECSLDEIFELASGMSENITTLPGQVLFC